MAGLIVAYLIDLGATTQYIAWIFEKQNQFERKINKISK